MTDITDAQRAEAAELGIQIRGRMNSETLQIRIDNAKAGNPVSDELEAPAEPEKMETVKIIKDGYRPSSTAGQEPYLPKYLLRIGDVVELPEWEVKHCIKNRIATRDIDAPETEAIDSWAEHDGYTS